MTSNQPRNFILTAILCLITLMVSAQAKGPVIRGNVVEESGGPMIGAGVSLLRAADSVLVKIIPSDAEGKFQFEEVKEGDYIITITAIGYKKSYSGIVKIAPGQNDLALEAIKLSPQAKELAAVEIKSVKPLVQVKADRMIFNVSSSINATGSNALELLGKSPGVRVDNNNISVNGKNRVMVYIDGRPTNLSGNDLAAVLTGIQSSNIDAIEVITNPSSKYPAAGNAGIIDIRLKKNKSYGFNGNASLTTSFGHTPKYDAAANFNYRNKSYNLFGNYGYQYGDNRTLGDFFRQVKDKASTTTFDQHAIYNRNNNNHNYKAGADFFLSKKSTIGVLVNGGFISGPFDMNSLTNIYKVPGTVDSVLNSQNRQNKKLRRTNYNINYQYQDDNGRTLNIDADYGNFTNDLNSTQGNVYSKPSGEALRTRQIKTVAATDIGIGAFKADYEQKALAGKLGVGIYYNGVETKNDFRLFNRLDNSDQLDSLGSRNFKYREKITAGYITYSRTLGKLNFQVGARVEGTSAKGDLTTYTAGAYQSLDTSYVNVFPSASVNYTLNDKSALGISYSKRIDRPSYEDLNPFVTILDELTYSQGNTFLKPQYTDNLQLSYNYKQVTAMLSYSRVKDFFTQVLDTLDQYKSVQTVKNIPYQYILSFTTTAQVDVTKWWSSYFYLNINNSKYKGNLNNSYLNLNQTRLLLYNENNFNLSGGWNIQLSGYYNGPSVEGTTRWRSVWTIDWGVQKKVFDDKGVVKLMVTDVFNTLNPGGLIDFSGTYLRSSFKPETRQLRLSFNYRFGSNTVKQARKRSTSADIQSKRIKDK